MQYFYVSALFLFSGVLKGQCTAESGAIRQTSWQQRADHSIRVRLDPSTRMLHAEQTIHYYNNSPDVLSSIRMHVWPNAFSSAKTEYGREAVIKDNSEFLHAGPEKRGYLDSLNFTVNGQPAAYRQYDGKADIIELMLPSPLKPGDSAVIHTPFRVKIPWLFSRMGYSGSLFSITQWYPKPAVYDVNGWNTFSYLEQGEYYSEFGTYRVSITLPSHYIVGATGKLQQEEEVEWMSEIAEGTAEKRDSNQFKTLDFVQENVCDFAWFTDPGFRVSEKEVVLPGGHKVHIYSLMTADARGTSGTVLDAAENAIKYYSKRVGEYPYDFCTVVIGKLTAAGGMEYPMITICGDGSEGTVIHEVGHNWFQMMLGSQERRYPWMDESINTFYQWQAEGKSPKPWEPGKRIKISGSTSAFHIGYDLGVFQEGDLHSECYHGINYGTVVYSANPQRFSYLQEYLGKAMMDSCMGAYFVKWQYRHPLPGDIQDVFETVSGENLDWFFQGIIGGEVPDVAIKHARRSAAETEVRIVNKSGYSFPVKLEWLKGNESGYIWLKASDTVVHLPLADKVRLNPTGYLIESDFENNESRTRGIFRTYGTFKFGLPDLYKLGVKKVWAFPNFFTFNRYDGYTPGLILSNMTFPRKRLEWWAAPSYGINSGSLVGNAGIRRNIWFHKGLLSMAEIYATGKMYNHLPDSRRVNNLYYHGSGGVQVFMKRFRPWVQHRFEISSTYNRLEGPGAELFSDSFWQQRRDQGNTLFNLIWNRSSFQKAAPSAIQAQIEAGGNYQERSTDLTRKNYQFVKAGVNASKFFPYYFYKKPGAGLIVRGFASAMLFEKNADRTNGVFRPLVSGVSGVFDYGYRDVLPARSESSGEGGPWGHQLLSGTPAIRMIPSVIADVYVAGVNLSTHLIPKIPVKLFADAAWAGNTTGGKLYWAGGISLSKETGLSPVVFEINLPLIYSSGFKTAMAGKKWYEGWNFKMNLALYHPVNLAREIYQ